ncbi:MAG: hypothetical protein QF464_17195, partial [Myxococcota bacterium]|nr:hypothetical protein [Myxococcota bacterium]
MNTSRFPTSIFTSFAIAMVAVSGCTDDSGPNCTTDSLMTASGSLTVEGSGTALDLDDLSVVTANAAHTIEVAPS